MNALQLNNTPGRIAFINKKEYLFFSGFNYLGVNHLPEFKALVKEGIDKYGLLFPSSRISNTQLKLFEAFEILLSNITGSEATASFSSGYIAGRAATSLFEKELMNAPDSHPAILRNNSRLHDFKEWSDTIIEKINNSNASRNVIAADAINVLTGMINDFSFIKYIQKPVTIIIDDSHGIGLIGDKGDGISKLLPQKENIEYLFTYSLSKAFGINGGAVSCSKKIYERLVVLPEYTAATGMSSALMYAFIYAQELYKTQLKKLQQNINIFKGLVESLPINHHASLPVFILPAITSYEALLEKNVIISSFAYPDVNGEKINRVVLNALHTDEDLEGLSTALKKVLL